MAPTPFPTMQETREPGFQEFYIIVWVVIASLLLVVCITVFNRTAVCGPQNFDGNIGQPLETVEQNELDRVARQAVATNTLLTALSAVPYFQTEVFKKSNEEGNAKAEAKKQQEIKQRMEDRKEEEGKDGDFLPAKEDKATGGKDEVAEEVCSICLVEFELETTSTELCKELGCKHCFHAECLDQWLRVNPTCPLCKAKARPVLPAGQQPYHPGVGAMSRRNPVGPPSPSSNFTATSTPSSVSAFPSSASTHILRQTPPPRVTVAAATVGMSAGGLSSTNGINDRAGGCISPRHPSPPMVPLGTPLDNTRPGQLGIVELSNGSRRGAVAAEAASAMEFGVEHELETGGHATLAETRARKAVQKWRGLGAPPSSSATSLHGHQPHASGAAGSVQLRPGGGLTKSQRECHISTLDLHFDSVLSTWPPLTPSSNTSASHGRGISWNASSHGQDHTTNHASSNGHALSHAGDLPLAPSRLGGTHHHDHSHTNTPGHDHDSSHAGSHSHGHSSSHAGSRGHSPLRRSPTTSGTSALPTTSSTASTIHGCGYSLHASSHGQDHTTSHASSNGHASSFPGNHGHEHTSSQTSSHGHTSSHAGSHGHTATSGHGHASSHAGSRGHGHPTTPDHGNDSSHAGSHGHGNKTTHGNGHASNHVSGSNLDGHTTTTPGHGHTTTPGHGHDSSHAGSHGHTTTHGHGHDSSHAGSHGHGHTTAPGHGHTSSHAGSHGHASSHAGSHGHGHKTTHGNGHASSHVSGSSLDGHTTTAPGHGHDSNHAGTHGHTTTPGHDHDSSHAGSHGHGHTTAPGHGHTSSHTGSHGHTTTHGHGHGHGYDSSHAGSHGHSSSHGHGHTSSRASSHGHGHTTSHGHGHASSHGSHGHSSIHGHGHTTTHGHSHATTHGHNHTSNHAGSHGHKTSHGHGHASSHASSHGHSSGYGQGHATSPVDVHKTSHASGHSPLRSRINSHPHPISPTENKSTSPKKTRSPSRPVMLHQESEAI